MFTRRDIYKLMNILCATAAAAGFLETERCLELAGHDDPCASSFSNIGLGDSLAKAEIHSLGSFLIGTDYRGDRVVNDYDNCYQLLPI